MGRKPKNKTEIYDRLHDGELLDIEPEQQPTPRWSVSDMFDDFKALSKHDQSIFFKYMIRNFTAEEVVNLIMDK